MSFTYKLANGDYGSLLLPPSGTTLVIEASVLDNHSCVHIKDVDSPWRITTLCLPTVRWKTA